ncbi:MAG: hypothetical protein MH472_11775 [Bacteroidia bacterium]|nr:hypothetical protein [Bacteroidia bacterium]
MKKQTPIIFLLLIFGGHLFAQNSQPRAESKKQEKTEKELPKRHLGISANAGTTGFGGSLNIKLAKKIELTVGYSMMNVSGKLQTTFDNQTVDLTVENKNNYASIIFNLYPSVNSSFHFLLGAINSGNNFAIKAISADSQEYGKITFSPDQLGKLDFNLKGAEWMPIAGIGFGRAIPNKRIGFGLDLGAAYWGKLNTTITAEKAFEPTNDANNVSVLNNAFSDFNWLPFINLRLNIKLF